MKWVLSCSKFNSKPVLWVQTVEVACFSQNEAMKFETKELTQDFKCKNKLWYFEVTQEVENEIKY